MLSNFEDMSWSDVRDQFRKWRENNERKSDEVILLWEGILEDRVQKTGNERHLILEQVIMAAFDTSRFDIATKCIKELSVEFPGSMRVMKFKAMRLEALERFDEAADVLDAIIAKDETCAAPRKRKIAILKARGKRGEAIKELTEYLKKFMSDQEAWHDLSSLYLAEADYGKALFCMEEMLLHNPHSHLINQRIAEIRYTMGGIENIETARVYYSQAVKLNPNNLRALYGIYLCCNAISNSRVLGSKRKEAQKIGQWALEKATARTEEHSTIKKNAKLIAALDTALGNLEIKSN
ncbi:ER membrane protein complex subunit 2-like [Teleopsis dalmanni]|uniref:ER membrane protein complex subunit 2-like n=1 Tax=Teleopsis dalmanni TaxID=139649 RepID=UPI000D32C8F3|nr:ER membrane protein complex subunit 2-like [Teleopsis dalmanni]XP_037954244.1 ER membrane protein complex subunit 2-like [Teleopsis dalmanni]